MGYFQISSKKKLAEMNIGDRIDESDFASMTDSGEFVQMTYHEDERKVESVIAKPGVFSMVRTMMGMRLEKTEFVSDSILRSFVNTKEVVDKIEMFFSKIDVYKRYGFDIAKRGILLYGPAGSGKSTIISEVAQQYTKDSKTFILVWHTDKIDAGDVKSFIKHLKYEGVEKMILVVEDIGGIEVDNARIRSESSLLSLLDNQEKSFTIPVLILATTNYPANFMGNLTNRPNRFDDKIEVTYPPAAARSELLRFFDKDNLVDDMAIKAIEGKDAEDFTPAHIREVIIRSAIYDKKVADVIKEMQNEIKKFKNAFEEKRNMGMGIGGF